MRWSPEQSAALTAVANWLREPGQQVFRLFGYAGTGKTTLARHLSESASGEVLGAAYTGKAAHVMRGMGWPEATTIHSLIYHTKDKGRVALRSLEAELIEVLGEIRQDLSNDDPERQAQRIDEDRTVRTLRQKIELEREELSRPMFTLNSDSVVRDAGLVVIDECSMVDERMGMDLLGFGVKVLVLGDPAQLPPVGGAGFFTGEGTRPDIMLTEIHRQAANNPIIAMATRVRQRQSLELGSYGQSRVIEQDLICEQDALSADQILVGRNKTRHSSNRRMRSLRGITELLPVPDDRLVCLRNNHDRGLLNGAIWYVDDVGETGADRLYMTIHPEDAGPPIGVEAHTHCFLGSDKSLTWWDRKDAEEFDYGYALTVHKAQGSEWGEVLLFDESWCFRANRWRWLYTGITRAAEKITVVRM